MTDFPKFTQKWFEELGGKDNFNGIKNVVDFDKPLKFLEIGSYEGNAHHHMYSQLFKNEMSVSTVIDPFGGGTGNSLHTDVYALFKNNLRPYLDRITILRGLSDNILPDLKLKYDIIYVDGDHFASAAYKDGKNSWKNLVKNGIMIFDDYLWYHSFTKDGIDAIGGEHHPALGINRFLKEIHGEYRLLGKNDGLKKDV